MSDQLPAASSTKKRKRSGKERAERKSAAEQARIRAEELVAIARQDTTSGPQMTNGEQLIDGDQPSVPPQMKASDPPQPPDVARRIPQSLKSMNPLLKQARTFETQRLVKKIRFLRRKSDAMDEVSDLESQLLHLSKLDLHNVASTHIQLKLSKHHHFKHSPLPSAILGALTPSQTSEVSSSADAAARNKAENRLVSNKSVSDGVRGILAWLVGEPGSKLVHRGASGSTEQAGGVNPARKSPSQAKRSAHLAAAMDQPNRGPVEADQAARGIREETSESGSDEEDGDDMELRAADQAGWESGSISDESDEEVESDAESAESDTNSDLIPRKRANVQQTSRTIAPPKPIKPAKAQRLDRATARDTAITSSLFLPSLAVGFTRGDSDSDPDMDDDVDGSGVIGKKGAERKNRRGQRARQAIWEKKYGKSAKHVVKNRESEAQALAQQTQSNIRNAYGKRAGPAHANASKATTATAPSVSSTARRSETRAAAPQAGAVATGQAQKMHPSWEAARARKKLQIVPGAPAAQKITFD